MTNPFDISEKDPENLALAKELLRDLRELEFKARAELETAIDAGNTADEITLRHALAKIAARVQEQDREVQRLRIPVIEMRVGIYESLLKFARNDLEQAQARNKVLSTPINCINAQQQEVSP